MIDSAEVVGCASQRDEKSIEGLSIRGGVWVFWSVWHDQRRGGAVVCSPALAYSLEPTLA